VPGFTITGELSSSPFGSTWSAVRTHDHRRLVVKTLSVLDVVQAQAQAAHLTRVLHRIDSEHLLRHHDAFALADGTLALVLDEVAGGSLSHLLGDNGPLTPGETVTTIAPLFGALADLHAADIVHGDLAPDRILYSDDGRPQMSGLETALLRGRCPGTASECSDFVAPELLGGADPSPASDVYAMAAIGWFCLTGAPPTQAAACPTVTSVEPEELPRLVEVLTSCLSSDPAARPSANTVAGQVFDAASAEPVRRGLVPDPAGEITRRIRAAAVAAPLMTPQPTGKRHRPALVIGVVALVLAVGLGGGATWFMGVRSVAAAPLAVRSTPQPSRVSATAGDSRVPAAASPQKITDVVTAPDSPRKAAAGLLQALVDARALAYAARDPALLDLVYAPAAAKAVVDRSNVTTALRNGATYLGLRFVVKDVAFIDGDPDTARIRVTIVTPTYRTGQPDGRKVVHQQEVVGPSVFTVKLTPDGWRILSMAMD